MDNLTRRNVMIYGMMKKRKKNILEVKERNFLITDFLAKRIKLKKWLLGSMTFILSIIYFISIEQYNDIPFAEAETEVWIEGLTTTFLFMFSIVIGFIVISMILIPKDSHNHIKKEVF